MGEQLEAKAFKLASMTCSYWIFERLHLVELFGNDLMGCRLNKSLGMLWLVPKAT
jgi:hypothetical protein